MSRGPARIFALVAGAVLLAGCTPSAAPTTTPSSPQTASPSASGTPTWAEVEGRVGAAVFRLQVEPCGEGAGWTGSGFAIDDDLVVTAAHVVVGAASITLESREVSTTGHVLGYDQATDIALLRLDGYSPDVLAWAESAAAATGPAAVAGYPAGSREQGFDVTAITGTDGSLHRRTSTGVTTLTGLFTLDPSVDAGTSGGPLLDPSGRVLGVVSSAAAPFLASAGDGEGDARTEYAIPASAVLPQLEDWRTETGGPDMCHPPDGIHLATNIADFEGDQLVAAEVLDGFWRDVNADSLDAAWTRLSPSGQRAKGGFESWSAEVAGTRYSNAWIEDVQLGSYWGSVTTSVTTTQPQADDQPEECLNWRVRYSLVKDEGTWLIGPTQRLSRLPC